MQIYSDGWSDWEDQLNRKTDRHRKAAIRRTRIGHRIAIVLETALFLAVIALLALDHTGQLPSVIALPLAALAIVVMAFCAGFVLGAGKAREGCV